MEDHSDVSEVISSGNRSSASIEHTNANTEVTKEIDFETSAINAIIEEASTGGSSQHRAKAFILNTENNDWEEMATGICSPEPSEVKSNDSYNAIHSILII